MSVSTRASKAVLQGMICVNGTLPAPRKPVRTVTGTRVSSVSPIPRNFGEMMS